VSHLWPGSTTEKFLDEFGFYLLHNFLFPLKKNSTNYYYFVKQLLPGKQKTRTITSKNSSNQTASRRNKPNKTE
jgi:hypothetical protein